MKHKFKYLVNNNKYNMKYIILLHCLKNKKRNTNRNTKRNFLLLKNTNKPHIKN